MAEKSEYPESYYCALTQAVMDDPYIDPEGNTYEKTAIFKWLDQKQTSPITRAPLQKSDLVPNRALQDAIRAALKEGPAREAPIVLTDSMVVGESPPTVHILKSNGNTLISVRPDVGLSRSPVDLVAVIDVSGSMQTEATMMNEKGGKEAHGLTLLDIVKHATRTLINTLGPGDRFGIVSFSTQAKQVLELTVMDKKGQELAEKALDKLAPDASTNIWDGLRLGMDVLRAGNRDEVGRLQSCFLLTDGCPNVEPPRGHLPMLERYFSKHPELQLQLCTFGFGYNLDSKLLDDLARVGGGRYGFIPDATFVGTAFVHASANTLCNAVKGAKLTLQPSGDVIPVTSLCYGQSSDVVVTSDVTGAVLTYQTRQGNVVSVEGEVGEGEDIEVEVQAVRTAFCTALRKAMDNSTQLENAQAVIHELVQRIQNSPALSDRRIAKLLEDAEGQVTEAFSRPDWFKKWGRHYIPSLLCAHQLQEANNFKDPGVQVYGGKLFGQLRDDADDIFNDLPPPKPSIRKDIDMYGRPVGGAARPAPVRSMAAYNNSRNVCFAGECMVAMHGGQTKAVDQLVAGDRVASGATIVCVVQSEAKALVRVNQKLLVTPWHPVSVDGGRSWEFPAHIGQPDIQATSVPVYSFVLDSHHLMSIEGVLAVSLGHGFKGDIRENQFWGTRKVVDALSCLKGYAPKGYVVIEERQIIRDHAGVVNIVR